MNATKMRAAIVDKALFADRGNEVEKDCMGLVWRIGSVALTGSVAIALGLNLLFSIVCCLVATGIVFWRDILHSLFPLRVYRKNCLSVVYRQLEKLRLDPKNFQKS